MIINLEIYCLVETETEKAMHHKKLREILAGTVDQITEVDCEII